MEGFLANQKYRALAAIAAAVLIAVSTGAYLYLQPTSHTAPAVKVGAQTSSFLTEYPTPGAESLPNAIAVDSSGNVWTVLQNKTTLVEFNPTTSSFKTFPFPEPTGTKVMTWGLAVDNSRNLVWVADETSDVIWCFNITSTGFRKVPLQTVGATPFQLVLDNQGNVWCTEFVADKIGVVSADGHLAEMQIPIAGNPTGIAIDAHGKIWFNLLQTSGASDLFYVGSYLGGSFSFYNLTGRVDIPVGIAVDASGNVWLTQHGASLLSEYSPVTGQTKTFSTSIPKVGASYPYFVYVDPLNGNIWFNEHYGNAIGEFDPSSGQMVEYHLTPGPSSYGNISGILTMSLTTAGTPWFAEVYTGKIGTLNSTEPLNLSLALSGASLGQEISISNKSFATLQMRITSGSRLPVFLSAAVGNTTNTLSFSFSNASGYGNFTSAVTIADSSASSGVYFVTISAVTTGLTISQVVQIRSG